MSRATAAERVERILSVLPWIVEEQGATVTQVCERFQLTERELIGDLDLLMYEVGIHPFTPDARVDVLFEDDRIYVTLGDYFRRPLRLSHEEAVALFAAGTALLDRADPDPTLQRAVGKLGDALGSGTAEAVGVSLGDADPVVLAAVQDAARDHRRVAIDYWSFGRDVVTHREVDPRRVVAEDGHWYLFGWCHLAGAPRSFRVDRIASVGATEVRFDPDGQEDGAGFDLSAADRTVELVVAPADAWVADMYPTVESEVLADGRMRIVLQVTATPWLERLLLRLGPDATGRDLDDGRDLAGLAARAAGRVLSRYTGAGPVPPVAE